VLGPQAGQSLEAALAGDTVTGVPVPIAVRAAGGGAFAARALVRRPAGADSPGLCILAREGASAMPIVTDDTAAARFIQLFHAAPIAIATVGTDGRIGHFNAAFDAMFRTSTGAPVATGGSLIERVSPETRAQVAAAVAGSAQSGIIAPVNFGFGEKGERSGRLYLSRLAVPAGRTSDAMVVYAIDTTQERELELQFAQSQKMQAIGQLAGGVAHDFNNMLTVIIGFSELLLANHRPTDPSFRDIMEIKQNANRAAGMVRQLLAYSRQQTLRPQVLSLTDFITDLSSSLLSRAIGERVRIKVQHARDLWLVKADQSQLTQVIHNLVLNARDAMPEGGRLTIRTANLPAEEAAKLGRKGLEAIDYVLCEVTDTGTGMPPEVQARIFEPFFTTKEVGKGTGLGLSTVYGIVKQTGGYIYCDSTPGKGTTFSVLLPRYLEDGRGAGPAQRPEKKEKSADLTGQGTVLLVEDEEAVRRFAVRALERQGYQVLAAGSGVEALEMIEKAPRMPDLVVSDIVMPEMDGPALLKELRKRNPGIKIIFVSGYAEEALKSLDKDAEFAFLPKPFQLKELLGLVKETMER
jgi:two-component system cell cycle sensor histidine kinase/response regulator CckA